MAPCNAQFAICNLQFAISSPPHFSAAAFRTVESGTNDSAGPGQRSNLVRAQGTVNDAEIVDAAGEVEAGLRRGPRVREQGAAGAANVDVAGMRRQNPVFTFFDLLPVHVQLQG